jgi:hypothetical protein
VSRPGVFAGPAGYGRALLIGVSAGTLGTGITFEAVAASRGNAARDLLGTLQQKAGASPCLRTAPAFVGTCQQVVELRQQHDNLAILAGGLFVAAGHYGFDMEPPHASGVRGRDHAVSAREPCRSDASRVLVTLHRGESSMLRYAIRSGIVVAALAAPLVGACIDYHTAEECADIGTCPLPDAGDGGDGADGGDH